MPLQDHSSVWGSFPMLCHPSQRCLWVQNSTPLSASCHMPTLPVARSSLSLSIYPRLNQDHFPLWISPQNVVVLFLSRALENFDFNGGYQNYTWVEFRKQRKKDSLGKNGKGFSHGSTGSGFARTWQSLAGILPTEGAVSLTYAGLPPEAC